MSSIGAHVQNDTIVRPVLRITRRGRIVLGTLVSLPAVAVIASIALSALPATATDESAGGTFEYVTVASGESLWSVAERVAPMSDPREVISDIERLNGLESSDIAAGASLAIPAAYTR